MCEAGTVRVAIDSLVSSGQVQNCSRSTKGIAKSEAGVHSQSGKILHAVYAMSE